MKKFISILGAIAFLSFVGTASLTACKKKEKEETPAKTVPAPETAPSPSGTK